MVTAVEPGRALRFRVVDRFPRYSNHPKRDRGTHTIQDIYKIGVRKPLNLHKISVSFELKLL